MAPNPPPAPAKAAAPARASVVQPPAPKNEFEEAAALINKAEAARKAAEVEAQKPAALPQNVLDEMEAGKAALARHAGAPKA